MIPHIFRFFRWLPHLKIKVSVPSILTLRYRHGYLGGGFKHFLMFTPIWGRCSPILTRTYFSDGLVQPPTSQVFQILFKSSVLQTSLRAINPPFARSLWQIAHAIPRWSRLWSVWGGRGATLPSLFSWSNKSLATRTCLPTGPPPQEGNLFSSVVLVPSFV